MRLYKTVRSSVLIKKYEKLGYKLEYFTYTGGDFSTLSAYMVKEL